jgi:hypothetical protein
MGKSLCKLTLAYPLTAEDRIVELMLETTPPIGGFTTMRAEGHGQDFAEASVNERVRGRVRRGVLIAVMIKGRADQLLAELEAKVPLRYLAYWLEPVISFGRMAPVVTTPDDAAGQGNAGGGPSKQQEGLKA